MRASILKLATKISIECGTYTGVTPNDPEYKILDPVLTDEMAEAAMNRPITAPYNRPSTLQDLDAKKRTEIDMFAGTVVRLGRKLGVATPVNELFYHGIRVLEEKNEGKYSPENT